MLTRIGLCQAAVQAGNAAATQHGNAQAARAVMQSIRRLQGARAQAKPLTWPVQLHAWHA